MKSGSVKTLAAFLSAVVLAPVCTHAQAIAINPADPLHRVGPADIPCVIQAAIRHGVPANVLLALASVDERLRQEGIRDEVSIIVGGSIRSSADIVKAIALGADAVYIATSALLALGCHLCRSCNQ